jgi:hypothetical protein
MLSVAADNSSLNQILRQISLETGMKITGGVADERVFGHYGPSAPSQVLANLLDGTGSNMLLLHRDGLAPAELVLTPRMGGPTPPNPNAAIFNEQPEPQEKPEHNKPHDPASSSKSNHFATAPASPNQANSSDPTQPESPNGVKTPQQIYQQLQRLHQQQQAPPQ